MYSVAGFASLRQALRHSEIYRLKFTLIFACSREAFRFYFD